MGDRSDSPDRYRWVTDQTPWTDTDGRQIRLPGQIQMGDRSDFLDRYRWVIDQISWTDTDG